jgi:twitching motility protein PilT
MQLADILRTAHEHESSDIHLIAGHPPMMRVNTVMTPLDYPMLTPEGVEKTLRGIISESQWERFQEVLDLDFSYEVQGMNRYRVNAHMQRATIGLALRVIKTHAPPMEALNLPEVISRLTYLPRGLVLVTGDTGSGKTTTLASMIESMNERYRKHIITLEDPIEYALQSKKCLIEQRELGQDMPSFASGLKHSLRQDPDIILVG